MSGGGAANPAVWTVTDPGGHLGFSGAGLALTGGSGFDGQTTLVANDPVEMGGTLVVEAGSLQLAAFSDGVICGFYQGAVTRANCFVGYNIRQQGGGTIATPVLHGVEVGTSLTIQAGHRYTLRMRLHCAELQRVLQTYYAMVDGAIESFGGGLVPAAMQVVFEYIDLGLSSNTPATMLYDSAMAGPIVVTPASCTVAAIDSVQLIGSMGYCRVSQTGSAWITSTLLSGQASTRLVGVAGEGVDCKVSASVYGTSVVTFYAGRVPVPGEIVTVTYRSHQRAVARLEDAASVAREAAGDAPGRAAWLGKVLSPFARSTRDCESAAEAVLSFASSRAAAIAGTYVVTNPRGEAEIWPGDVLALNSGGQRMNVMTRAVSISDAGSTPETLTYRIAFANDWAEALGIRLSEAVASDALLPLTALEGPAVVLPMLLQMTVVSVTDSAIQVDAGTVAPSGGGFEVRRRDGDFGPAVDQDLVLRSPVRSFVIPREAQVERYFVRMYDGSMPPIYSRLSSAIFTSVPVA